MDEMAAPTRRWLLQKVAQNGHYYYTGSNIFMTNKAAVVDESLAKNPYYEKYAAKINKLKQEDPMKLVTSIEELATKKKPKKISEVVGIVTPTGEIKKKPDSTAAYSHSKEKKLSALMKTELIKDKSPSEIKLLWHSYFKDKFVVSAVIPSEVYEQQSKRTLEYPTFLLPLPREEGYEFTVCQFAGNEAHLTSLINFQVHGENAPESLTVTYYPELAGEKGIVLVKADYDKNVLSAVEAQCLVNQVQLYYGQPDDRKLSLLKQFNQDPDSFQHMDLVHELENIKLF